MWACAVFGVAAAEEAGPRDLVMHYESARVEGRKYFLRGAVRLETAEMVLRADEVDYDEETHKAEARGNIEFIHLASGERLEAERVEYDLSKRTGRFYEIRGSSPPSGERRLGVLGTGNPFVFGGSWAERLGDRYILYDGYITNCLLPDPWWTLRGREFEIVPGERAIARQSSFRLRGVPLFWAPYFYKSLEERPRKSGFLTPGIGNSSRRGMVLGGGYYWAFDRSYDLMYRSQWFTERGFAHNFDVRGKPGQAMEFDAQVYGVNDNKKNGGLLLAVHGKAKLGWGFDGRADVNYLSSFAFRQEFTESFSEQISSEVRSLGFATRHWDTHSLALVAQRTETFQSTAPGDKIVIRKLPSAEFTARERQLGRLPVWVSLEAGTALVRRTQPLFQTRQYVDRLDVAPRVTAAVRWKEFQLVPSLGIRETSYGSSVRSGRVSGEGVLRSVREFSVELVAPSLARVYEAPGWLGEQVKHVIEARAGFRWTGGVDDFHRFVRFDETELVTNTREVDLLLTNRLYAKRGGVVQEVLSWQLWQKRYLDAELGGAINTRSRNVFRTQTQMTAFAFFDRARRYSPVASTLQFRPQPAWSAEWRSDYDPLRKRFTNSTLMGVFRHEKYSVSAGHNLVRSSPVLSPNTNQFIGSMGWGNPDERGWSVRFQSLYDFRTAKMAFATTQATYNSDCCGLSFQYTRFGIDSRNDFRVAFAIANIGSFGTLRRQERLY